MTSTMDAYLRMSQGGSDASKIVGSIQDLGINQINLSAIFIHRSRFQCTLLHLLFQTAPKCGIQNYSCLIFSQVYITGGDANLERDLCDI